MKTVKERLEAALIAASECRIRLEMLRPEVSIISARSCDSIHEALREAERLDMEIRVVLDAVEMAERELKKLV